MKPNMDQAHRDKLNEMLEDKLYFYYSFVSQHGKPITELISSQEVPLQKGAEISLVNVQNPSSHHDFQSLKGNIQSVSQESAFIEAGFPRFYFTVTVKINYKKQVLLDETNSSNHKRVYQGGLIANA